MTGKRGMKGLDIENLPYKMKIYMNNQVLIPAKLIRKLNLQNAKEARITFRYRGNTVTITAKLLRTKYTDSRQFTIPKSIREQYSIKPGDEVEIISIEEVI